MSVYKVITIIGTSPESWEKATTNAIEQASETLEDLRVAEVEMLDVRLDGGKIIEYRARLKVSFKYHEEERT